MDIVHNTATHISSVVMHILIRYMHILLPYPCHMLHLTCAYHVTWWNFYMSQIHGCTFHQTFFLRVTALILNFFKLFSRHDNNDECMLFTDIQHSQLHMTFYQEVVFCSWGGIILHKVWLLIIVLFSVSHDF